MKRLVPLLLLLGCHQLPAAKVGGNTGGPGDSFDMMPLVTSLGAQTPITWSVSPGGGTITQGGVYTAPTCSVMVASLSPGTDLRHAGTITSVDTVTATWPGGSVNINITVSEVVLGVDVIPATATTGPGGTAEFIAVIHYTCHDQTTAP